MKIGRKILAASLAAWMLSSAFAANDGVSVTPTIQTAAYASGNAIGGLQKVPLFRNASVVTTGFLDLVQVSSKSGATTAITIYIYDTLPAATTCTDKSAFSEGAADVSKRAVQPFTLTPAATPGSSVASAQLVQVASVANQDSPTTNFIYVCPVVGGSVTPASVSDLVFKYSVALD